MTEPTSIAEYERRIESIRSSLLRALNNPIRLTGDDMRTHIANLVRSAEAASPRKPARPDRRKRK
jgi:hypothetical protein